MIRIIKESVEDDFDDMFDFGDENAEWYDSIYIPKECIRGATLLSKEEYEKYKDNIPEIRKIWWLRSAGYKSWFACGVYKNGYVDCEFGVGVDQYRIRPALILDLQSSNLDFKIGDKLGFGKYPFTVISNSLAICDDFIGKGCFRKDYEAEDANDYEKSDIKKVVDDWFNKAYAEYEG